MLNVHDLERRWLRYKIKRYAPIIGSGIVGILGIILFFIYLPSSSQTPSEVIKEVTQVQTPVKTENNLPPVSIVSSIEVPENTQIQEVHKEKTLVLKPSLQFMNNIEDGLNPYFEGTYEAPIEENSNERYINEGTPTEQSVQATQTIDIQEPDKRKSSLTITTKKNEIDLKDVIRRFKKNKNPALSLFIAKRYYELGKYQKSYNYALMTNEINKEIDESWIIFSKSLVKLGQHELATVTLKSYLKTKKSSQAEILLRKIESGTFK